MQPGGQTGRFLVRSVEPLLQIDRSVGRGVETVFKAKTNDGDERVEERGPNCSLVLRKGRKQLEKRLHAPTYAQARSQSF